MELDNADTKILCELPLYFFLCCYLDTSGYCFSVSKDHLPIKMAQNLAMDCGGGL